LVQTIRTKRLVIKPYEKKDLEALSELLLDEEIKRSFMIPDLGTKEALDRMLDKLYRYSLSDEHFERGIYLNGILIGFVNDVEIHEGTIELGYVISPLYKGQGYATEMLKAVIQALLGNGFDTIITASFDWNAGSIRVMEKSGMHRISRDEHVLYHGKDERCVYYSTASS
jgi:ribosomal-protein-alanine N-acetyltransferase